MTWSHPRIVWKTWNTEGRKATQAFAPRGYFLLSSIAHLFRGRIFLSHLSIRIKKVNKQTWNAVCQILSREFFNKFYLLIFVSQDKQLVLWEVLCWHSNSWQQHCGNGRWHNHLCHMSQGGQHQDWREHLGHSGSSWYHPTVLLHNCGGHRGP